MPLAHSAPFPRAPARLPADAPPRNARRKEARPGELLDAALTLFVEKGYATTRVEEVAAQAGVSKGTLFLYYPSKEELFKAVVRETIAGRFAEWNDELDHFEGTSAELVAHFMRAWWQRIGMTRASGITKLVMSEASQFPEIAQFYQREVIQPGKGLIRRVLQRGIDRGEIRPMDLDFTIYSVIAPMVFLAMWKHAMAPCCGAAEQIDPQGFINSQVDLLLHGMLVRVDAPHPTSLST